MRIDFVLCIQQWMVIRDPRLEAEMVVRLAEAAGVGELQADEEAVDGAERVAMSGGEFAQERFEASAVGRTAAASPPQINFAPLIPKFRQRRSVCSEGEPSALASQPSIGWMHQRLPTVKLPTLIGVASGEPASAERISSSMGSDWPSS